MTFIFLSIFAHSMVDFVFLRRFIAEKKATSEWQGYIIHGLLVFIFIFVFTHIYGIMLSLKLAFLLSAIHILIDYFINCKYFIRIRKKHRQIAIVIFILDQVVYTLVLMKIALLEGVQNCGLEGNISGFYVNMFPWLSNIAQYYKIINLSLTINHLLLAGIIFVYSIFGASVFIGLVLDYFFPEKIPTVGEENNKNLWNQYVISVWIGYLERLLILILVLCNSLQAVAFVMTAKSLARYKELEEKSFAELYLIGTLLSTVIALLGGLLVKNITTIIH